MGAWVVGSKYFAKLQRRNDLTSWKTVAFLQRCDLRLLKNYRRNRLTNRGNGSLRFKVSQRNLRPILSNCSLTPRIFLQTLSVIVPLWMLLFRSKDFCFLFLKSELRMKERITNRRGAIGEARREWPTIQISIWSAEMYYRISYFQLRSRCLRIYHEIYHLAEQTTSFSGR